ncbi:hypothetical protein C8F04DRAFT_1110556 [Mycena alexandri]|uniref:Uncharacterized protein n=1 Tax=Mycena alexandri TaxID=1745969 RepID=A0AAD6SQ09_9AGAR|nr:hypothetical protein C8F04DRAFT_1110556 [Mycena alexandri]
MIFRMAFDLVLGALVVLIRWRRKAPLKIAKFLACIARDLDLWFGSQIYSLMVILACNFRTATLEFVSDGVIAACLLDSVYNLLARPPPPPPPPVFLNCKTQSIRATNFLGSLTREVDFWLAAQFYSAATIIVFSVGMLPTISHLLSDLIIVAYLDYFLYHLCVHSPPPLPPPPGRKRKRWYHHQ